MFLHHILNCDDTRLVNQVFWAQVESPAKNDWVHQIEDNLKVIGLEYLSLNNIKNMKKEQFKSLVKLKCQKAGFEFLMNIKENKSKMSRNTYTELKIQPYLISGNINLRRKQLLFKLRNRMMPTSENFGMNRMCRICQIEPDTTSHLFSCLFLKSVVPEVLGLDDNDKSMEKKRRTPTKNLVKRY